MFKGMVDGFRFLFRVLKLHLRGLSRAEERREKQGRNMLKHEQGIAVSDRLRLPALLLSLFSFVRPQPVSQPPNAEEHSAGIGDAAKPLAKRQQAQPQSKTW